MIGSKKNVCTCLLPPNSVISEVFEEISPHIVDGNDFYLIGSNDLSPTVKPGLIVFPISHPAEVKMTCTEDDE